jgi:AcrR family transcriptional regulator
VARESSAYRQAILEAGTRLFHEKGFSRTTTDEIAAEAHITKRTLYRYIDSKESLLLAVHEQLFERLLEPVNLRGTVRQRLTALIENYVDTVLTHKDQMRMFFEERKHLTPESQERVAARREEHEELFRRTLAEGVASGAFRNLDVTLATRGILGAVTSLYTWYDASGWLTPGDVAAMISALFSDGLVAMAGSFQPIGQLAGAPVGVGASAESHRAYDDEEKEVAEEAEIPWAESTVLSNILDVASTMIHQRGYDNTNTRELADAAGLTKSALYYYVPNKEAILFQLNLRLARSGLDAEREIIDANPQPVDALREIVTWQCRTIAENLGALQSLSYEMRFLESAHYRQIQLLRSDYAEFFISVLGRCGNWAVPQLAHAVGLSILGMMNFVNEWYTPNDPLDPNEIGREFFSLVWDGILKSTPRAPSI